MKNPETFRAICFCTGALRTTQAEGAKSEPRPSPGSGAAGKVGASTFSWAAHGAPTDIAQTTRTLGTRYRANLASLRIAAPRKLPSSRNVTRRERATAMPRRDPSGHPRNGRFSCGCRLTTGWFRAVCAITRSRVRARSALMEPTTRRQLRRSRGVFEGLPYEGVERRSVPAGGISFAMHMDGRHQRWHSEESYRVWLSFSHSRA